MSYSYARSIKSNFADEPVNTLIIRPLAGLLVRLLYSTPLTPNHVTILSIVAGCIAAALYAHSATGTPIAAGLWLTCKDILDSADGQLARVRGTSSRAGRFLDSIGDLLVNLVVFAAIAVAFSHVTPGPAILCALAFAGTTLRVSYHVYYHTSYLHLEEKYQTNRVSEEVRPVDLQEPATTLILQRIFQFLYGWQDRLMANLDAWSCRGRVHTRETAATWFGNLTGVRFTGMMGLGSELFLLMVFSVFGGIERYLWFNVVGLNIWWGLSVGYRRGLLARRLPA